MRLIFLMLLTISTMLLSCKKEAGIKITTLKGAGAKASNATLTGTIYTVATTSSTVSATQSATSAATVKIYKLTSGETEPTLLATTTSNDSGLYSQALVLNDASSLLVVAEKDAASIGQAIVTPGASLTSTTQSLSADITIKSTIIAALLLKKQVNLEALSTEALIAIAKIIDEQITANPSTQPLTLISELSSSTSFTTSLASATDDQDASNDRSSEGFDKLTGVILYSGTAKTILTSVEIVLTNASTAKNSSTQATAFAIYSDGSRIEVTSKATWTATNSGIVSVTTVNGSVAVTGVTEGSTTISASFGGKTSQTSISITAAIPVAAPPNPTSQVSNVDSPTQITLSWNSAGGTTSSYIIAYQTGATAPANCSTGTITTSTTASKIITGLSTGTQYSFRICAVNNNDTPDVSSGVTLSATTTSVLVSSWADGEANTANGINKDPTRRGLYQRLTAFNGKLYASWNENNAGGVDQVRISVYNGNDSAPSWTFVDGNGANGLNYNTAEMSGDTILNVFNSKLYAAWWEANSGVGQIRVAVYNGNDSAPSWSFVTGASGLNKDPTKYAVLPYIYEFNSKLYIAWSEQIAGAINQMRVAVYNGNDSAPSWSFVDGNGVTGINKNTGVRAYYARLIALNSKLYLTWHEGTPAQVRVAVYNGNDSAPSWSFVDGNAATGLNKDTTKLAYEPRPAVFNSKLYLTWREQTTIEQIRVVVYNGNDSSPSWSFVDGNGVTGLNKDTTLAAGYQEIVAAGTILYVSWSDGVAGTGQVRVAAFNGNDSAPSWSFVDGNAATGLNVDTNVTAWYPFITTFNSKLYLIWKEAFLTHVAVGQ